MQESGFDFKKYLNGNPAMLEIWSDALSRIEANVELAPVQEVVVQEWLHRAKARKMELQLKSQRGMLPDAQYVELQTLHEEISNIELQLRRVSDEAGRHGGDSEVGPSDATGG